MKKQSPAKLAFLTETVRVLDPADLGKAAGARTLFVTCTCPRTQGCTVDC